MRTRCSGRQRMTPETCVLSAAVAPCEPDEPFPTDFQCDLDDTPHDFHCAFARNIPGDERDVFFCWNDTRQWVIVLMACLNRHPNRELCLSYYGHPGVCDWAYLDVERVAIPAELDQVVTYEREHGWPSLREGETSS